ncbi:MAG: methyltransferase C-terminal domain-containing protein, partial [Dehalococcoidia bacterium]
LLSAHGLRVFDVEELSTHGGSLRLYVCHDESERHVEQPSVADLADEERHRGILDLDRYAAFQRQVERVKYSVLDFLIHEKRAGHRIAAYGAPGKGNTLLNYCGIRSDFIDYVVDRNPGKQGSFTPGTHIPILHPDEIRRTRPDVVLVMPWNIKDEIVEQHRYIEEWGGRFVIFLPEVLELRDGAWVPPSM